MKGHKQQQLQLFIRAHKKFTIQNKYNKKITKTQEHSHVEIAKTNRGKWLGQAERNCKRVTVARYSDDKS